MVNGESENPCYPAHLSSGPEVVLETSKSYKVGPHELQMGCLTPINGLKIGQLKL